MPTLDHQDPQVTHVIKQLDELGWEAFQFGLIPVSWMEYQAQYLENIGSKVSGKIWMSRLIRQIWALHKQMWIERNSHVHGDGKSIHQAEIEAVDKAIRMEFTTGLDGLPAEFLKGFSGSVEDIIDRRNPVRKQQWLASIWYARDFLREARGLDPISRDPLAQAFITRFQVRRKRRRSNDG